MKGQGKLLSGREARRSAEFGPERRRKGAGWTRSFRKGREQRQLTTKTLDESNLAAPPEEEETP